MSAEFDAIVVGSGPNGLTAAVVLAQAGRRVCVLEAEATPGGGARTAQLTLPGFHHDVCSAVHPMAAMSPVFQEIGLPGTGVRFVHPDIPLTHPLDGGRGAALYRSLEATCAGLGEDGPAWSRFMAPFVERFETLKPTLLSPITRLPRDPLLLARFGVHVLQSAVGFASRGFTTDAAQALFGGCAAHSSSDLNDPLTATLGFVLALGAHAVGWPVIQGGTQRLIDGLVTLLERSGGELRCGERVESLSALPSSRAVLFDTSPWGLSRIAADALPPRFHRRAARFRRGPGVFKLDYALDGPVPWSHEPSRRAGTVHLGGTLPELATSEAAVARGELPERPYVLVAQQSLFDETRAPAGRHTLWAYCHVPNGCPVDMTSRIEAQLERFAPGFRDRVLARVTRGPAAYERYNANYEGGDISAGALDGLQLLLRPGLSWNAYRTPNPRLFLCSASTPPGPAVHGMCGYWAARAALAGVLA